MWGPPAILLPRWFEALGPAVLPLSSPAISKLEECQLPKTIASLFSLLLVVVIVFLLLLITIVLYFAENSLENLAFEKGYMLCLGFSF